MVTAIILENAVKLESTLEITKSQQNKIKANTRRVFDINQQLGITCLDTGVREGKITTTISVVKKEPFEPVREVKNITNLHRRFIAMIDDLPFNEKQIVDKKKHENNSSPKEPNANIYGFLVIPVIYEKNPE